VSAELEFLQGETPGRKVALSVAEITIGRDSSANLVLLQPSVSRHHAKLFHRHGNWYIVDLDSANGTLVNGTRISASPIQLRLGDLIQMGPVVLRFQDPVISGQPTQAWTDQQQPAMSQGMPVTSHETQQVVVPPHFERMSPVPAAYPQMPVQSGPQQQVVMVQGQQNLVWLWIFLCLVALGPCGLLCVAMLAIAVLPFVMVIGGLISAFVGLAMYRRFQGFPGWERHATKGMILMIGGFASAILGALWIFVAWLAPGSGTWNPPDATPTRETRPF